MSLFTEVAKTVVSLGWDTHVDTTGRGTAHRSRLAWPVKWYLSPLGFRALA